MYSKKYSDSEYEIEKVCCYLKVKKLITIKKLINRFLNNLCYLIKESLGI